MNSVMTAPSADYLSFGRFARQAFGVIRQASFSQRVSAIQAMARSLRSRSIAILAANAADVLQARKDGIATTLIDRLLLTDSRIEAIAAGLECVAALPDPLGNVLAEFNRPNGLHIARISVPLGVIGMIYESRPNVAADAGALSIFSGNAIILRGGSQSLRSAMEVYSAIVQGLELAGLPPTAIQHIPHADRGAVGAMLSGLEGAIDVIIPRGGKSLVARVQEEARIPVLAHLDGNNHVYVDREADLDMARAIVLNSKMRRVSVCGAAETLLVDRAAMRTHLLPLIKALLEAGCQVRGDSAVQAADVRVTAAGETDWQTEYLDAVMAVRVVDGVEDAIRHIETYGSRHTDAIVTANPGTARRFLTALDSAIVLWNASTQFADGGEFGFGAEIGIATGRLHARGPVGPAQLTTFKYIVSGTGQVRP